MPTLDEVSHEIPEQTNCKNCNKPTYPKQLKELTVKGKFIVFMSTCHACNAINWHFAGETKYIQEFSKTLKDIPIYKN